MNTDDYEGHTPAPWTIVWWEGTWYVDDENNGTVCELFGTAQKQDPTAKLIAAAPNLLAEIKRLQAYKEFADGIHEWSHGASFIHFLAEQVNHIRNTGELDEDALNHGCTSYYNGPNCSSQVSMLTFEKLLAEVKRLRENESELLSAISQYKEGK